MLLRGQERRTLRSIEISHWKESDVKKRKKKKRGQQTIIARVFGLSVSKKGASPYQRVPTNGRGYERGVGSGSATQKAHPDGT